MICTRSAVGTDTHVVYKSSELLTAESSIIIGQDLHWGSTFEKERLQLSDYVCSFLSNSRPLDRKPCGATIDQGQKFCVMSMSNRLQISRTLNPPFCHRTGAGSIDWHSSQLRTTDLTAAFNTDGLILRAKYNAH